MLYQLLLVCNACKDTVSCSNVNTSGSSFWVVVLIGLIGVGLMFVTQLLGVAVNKDKYD